MKKLILFTFFIILFGACGKEKKPIILTTISEKISKLEKASDGDQTSLKEITNIKKNLLEALNEGNKQAKIELEEWERLEKSKEKMGNRGKKHIF